MVQVLYECKRNRSEVLAEAVPEALKNVLLVMAAQGILAPSWTVRTHALHAKLPSNMYCRAHERLRHVVTALLNRFSDLVFNEDPQGERALLTLGSPHRIRLFCLLFARTQRGTASGT